MNDAEEDKRNGEAAAPARTARALIASLKPKGACWYCNQPLDSVRRFCNKSCADDFLTEEETFKRSGA
jgi:hypothetical protein